MEKDVLNKFDALLKKFKWFKNFDEINVWEHNDLRKIPVTTRRELAELDITKCPENPVYVLNTSGSSGSPTLFFISQRAFENHIKRVETASDLNKIPKGSIVFNLTEDPIVDHFYVRNGYTLVHSGTPSENTKHVIASKIKKTKPSLVISYLTIIHDILELVNEVKIGTVLGVGSMATPKFIDNIVKKSNSKFNMIYGTQEFGALGSQDYDYPDYYKAIEDGLYFEVAKENGEISTTGRGALLVTDLENMSTPFIRYFVGDLVEIMHEAGIKRIKVLGRCDNYMKIQGDIDLKEGIVWHMQEILGHDVFQVVVDNDKKSLKDFFIIYVPKKDFVYEEKMKRKLRREYGVEVSIQTLDFTIPKTSSGKRKNILDKRFMKQ